MVADPLLNVPRQWRSARRHLSLARIAWCCGMWACAAFLVLVTVSADAAEPKRVMFLHSFGRDFKPWNDYARHIRMELDRQSPWPLDIHEASLVTARFSDEDADAAFVDYLRALYAKHRLDLIVGIGGPAASFVQRHRQQLFPSTPMLLTAVEQRRIDQSGLTANDAVVAVSLDIAGVVENLLRVLPDTKNIAVVIGNSPVEKYWLQQVRNDLQPFANRVAFTWYNDLPFETVLKRAASLPPQSAIFLAMMSVDAAGVPHEEGKALARLHAAAGAPIFSYAEAYFTGEIVGGPLLSFADVSRPTAEAAVRILRGETAGDIKTPPVGLGTAKFDWREMQRWSIPESRLPPGSEIHFRQPSIWEQYRMQAIAAMAIVLLQSAMIAWLLIERNRRRVAEMESRRRLLQIAHMNRSATAGALSASIAHELNQPLGAILSNTEAAEMLLARDPPSIDVVKEILADVRNADLRAGEIINRLRGLLKKGEVSLQSIDLDEAIRNVVHILHPEAKDRGVILTTDQGQRALMACGDPVHLQQVLLNLAMNGMDAMLSSEPNNRRLAFETALNGDSQVEVSVSDTGPGIPQDKFQDIFEPFFTTKQQGMGLGLSIVRTIVETYGGRIWAENRLGGGAIFRFTLPLARAT